MVRITEKLGDLFQSPKDSVLVHACNCYGSWGAGVAKAFQIKYPAAYRHYRDYCLTPDTLHHKKWLVGTTLLIPPQQEDNQDANAPHHWIACLFTSMGSGRQVDKPDQILINTRMALVDFKKKLLATEKQTKIDFTNKVFTVRMNAVLFRVPWERTRHTLEQGGIPMQVVNNIAVMDERAAASVVEDMKANGFDPEGIAVYEKAMQIAAEPEVSDTNDKDDGEDDQENVEDDQEYVEDGQDDGEDGQDNGEDGQDNGETDQEEGEDGQKNESEADKQPEVVGRRRSPRLEEARKSKEAEKSKVAKATKPKKAKGSKAKSSKEVTAEMEESVEVEVEEAQSKDCEEAETADSGRKGSKRGRDEDEEPTQGQGKKKKKKKKKKKSKHSAAQK